MNMLHVLRDQAPGTTGFVGFTLATISTFGGLDQLVTLLIGVCTLVVVAPKAVEELRHWGAELWQLVKRLKAALWPARRRRK